MSGLARLALPFGCAAALAACGGSPSSTATAPPDAGPEAGVSPPTFWTGRPPVTSLGLDAVWGSGGDLYAVGQGGVIVHSADDGETWSVSLPGDSKALFYPFFGTVWGSSAADVYVGGADRGEQPLVVHSADHGRTWQTLDAALPGVPIKIWGSGPQDVYVAVDPGGVVHSTDGGRTWQTVYGGPSTGGTSVWGSAGNDVYAVGLTPTSAPAPDGGADAAADASADDGGAPDGGGAAIGFFVHSTDGGRTWAPIAAPPFGPLYDVSGTPDGRHVVACGPNLTQVMTTDHGQTWSVSAAPDVSFDLYRIWCPPDGEDCFIVSDEGLLSHLRVDPLGGTVAVTVEHLPPIVVQGSGEEVVAPRAIWGTSIHDVWAVSAMGAIWHGGP